MESLALSVITWLDAHPHTDGADRMRLLRQVPAWQWRIPGGHWPDLSAHCCNRVQPTVEPRPANALCVEISTPAARCLFRSPGGRGITRDGGTLDYLRSGGSVLAYGLCEQAHCDFSTRTV